MNKAELLMNLKVLYVEDDDDTRLQMKMILKKRVGRLLTAKNGEEGLESFKADAPDIVITDSRMPKLDGINMSRQIRTLNKKVPIIITTAFSEVEMILEAVDIGIEKYILKPINMEELMSALNQAGAKVLDEEDDLLVLNEDTLIEPEAKKALELKLQTAIALFIKEKTGKGPRNVKVFMRKGLIEIESYGTLTKYEATLLKNPKNYQMVQFSRESLYNGQEFELEKLINGVINAVCRLEKVTIDLKKEKDVLIVSYK